MVDHQGCIVDLLEPAIEDTVNCESPSTNEGYYHAKIFLILWLLLFILLNRLLLLFFSLLCFTKGYHNDTAKANEYAQYLDKADPFAKQ